MPRAKAPDDRDSYQMVHHRVRQTKGRADAHPCSAEGCDAQATEWAWDRTGPSREGTAYRGHALTWGLDLDTYKPMCKSHHRMLDRGGTLTHCPRGHDRSVGRNTHGLCRECAREDSRAWRRRQ